MRREAEANAEADRKRKELIEVRNQADNTIYTAEKMLREYGEKVPADVKKKIEDGVSRCARHEQRRRRADPRETEQLGRDIQAIGASMYQQPGGPAGRRSRAAKPGGNGGPGGQGPDHRRRCCGRRVPQRIIRFAV
jgi:molecular chaperone DnaK